MTQPFLFQLQDVRRIHKMGGRCLIANPMGTGKSFEALLYALRHPEQRPIVVVCPASVKWNWLHEATIHAGIRAEVLESRSPHKGRILKPPQLAIINYDILASWLKYLRKLRPQLIILDEVHMLQSRTTQRTRAARALCVGVPHVLALSGTPLINRPAELWPTLNILRPDLFPNWIEFARRHCAPTWKPWGWEFKGATDLDVLHRHLTKHLMVRRTKQEALPGLPSKSRVVVPLDIVGRKQYNHAVHDFLGWMAKHHRHKLSRAAKAERLVQLGYLKRLAGRLKLKSVMEWVDDFLVEAEGKLILFAIHKKIIRQLRQRYQSLCVVVTGDVTGRKRQQAIDAFQKNRRIRLFIGNLDAAGVGWNGTAAEAVAFAELGWSPGKHTQGEDRCHRIGQKRNTTAYYLVARDTIEQSLCQLLQDKQKTLDKVLDGGVTDDALDIFDRLTQELEAGGKR